MDNLRFHLGQGHLTGRCSRCGDLTALADMLPASDDHPLDHRLTAGPAAITAVAMEV
jgi:hypothetical protein